MYNIKDRNLYPKQYAKYATVQTTASSGTITSGSLTANNIYTILEEPVGGTPSFDGAVDLEVGTTFRATGTGATWGTTTTGELVDITTGNPEKIMFYDHTGAPVFYWLLVWNAEDKCVGFSVRWMDDTLAYSVDN